MAATSALEAWEACDKADTVFILVCSGLLLAYHPSCRPGLLWLFHQT
jgi:hypothetical protein